MSRQLSPLKSETTALESIVAWEAIMFGIVRLKGPPDARSWRISPVLWSVICIEVA